MSNNLIEKTLGGDLCYKCGVCCKGLTLEDKIKISIHTKTIMFDKNCKFLTSDNKCSIYLKRPNLCRKWICGPALKRFK